MAITHVPISPLPPERFRALVGESYREVEEAIGRAREIFRGRAIWHLNSTARGGGVAELLQSLLAYARGAGVDTRWAVIEGNPAFFALTKRIHNQLHGLLDDGPLGEHERTQYEATLAANAAELQELVQAGDIVFCHDPQTAGLVAPMIRTGATVVWRCHVGVDAANAIARRASDFLRPYVEPAAAYVFSRSQFAWEGLDPARVWIVQPSIDAFSPKNQHLTPETVSAVLRVVGLLPRDGVVPVFARVDGSPGRVDREAEIDQDGHLPLDAPLIAQVSRWDRLKDPVGVLRGFSDHCARRDAHLVLAGPAVDAISDDPEGAGTLEEVRGLRAALPADARRRTHLVCLPMDDIEENAVMVNAIQRRADVVVQKSLAEGFGLTVTEAMWKSRPVIASRCGAIQDMITDGESGVLLDDPRDLEAFGSACADLLADPDRAARIGAAARKRVAERFLGSRHLVQYLRLLEGIPSLGGEMAPAPSE